MGCSLSTERGKKAVNCAFFSSSFSNSGAVMYLCVCRKKKTSKS